MAYGLHGLRLLNALYLVLFLFLLAWCMSVVHQMHLKVVNKFESQDKKNTSVKPKKKNYYLWTKSTCMHIHTHTDENGRNVFLSSVLLWDLIPRIFYRNSSFCWKKTRNAVNVCCSLLKRGRLWGGWIVQTSRITVFMFVFIRNRVMHSRSLSLSMLGRFLLSDACASQYLGFCV